jgi:glycosyltransferase involved in cell wall biosynthesis
MACGKAVVTTPSGCTGLGLIHGRDALIHAGAREFACAVSALLSDAALRQTLAMNARRTAEQNLNWIVIADSAYNSYESLVGFRAGVKIPNRMAVPWESQIH